MQPQLRRSAGRAGAAPLGLLAELTHRCPLQCPYCSNPLALERAGGELPTEIGSRAREAAALGVLQLHLSGGEPPARRDLEEIVAQARRSGSTSTSSPRACCSTRERLDASPSAGLDHVQISIQDAEPANADRIAGYRGGHAKKLEVAGWVRERGLPLTINAVVHRQNLDQLEAMIASRRATSAPTGSRSRTSSTTAGRCKPRRPDADPRAGLRSAELVDAARERLKGGLAHRLRRARLLREAPEALHGRLGPRIINVTPSGKVLPCHAAASIPGLAFDNVRDKPLARHLARLGRLQAFRGTDWMREPCRSCELASVDCGGCRCQALRLAGEAEETDPACAKSPHHQAFSSAAAVD